MPTTAGPSKRRLHKTKFGISYQTRILRYPISSVALANRPTSVSSVYILLDALPTVDSNAFLYKTPSYLSTDRAGESGRKRKSRVIERSRILRNVTHAAKLCDVMYSWPSYWIREGLGKGASTKDADL
jgi:hypothetical protein